MMDSRITQTLQIIISEMKMKTGINIENFKLTFLERRVKHRMRDIGISDYDEYVTLLSTSFEEALLLYRSFSINVTKFFRDPHVWKVFEQNILPNFVHSRISPIRVWSCGSATGEEPYSLSILFYEYLKNKQTEYKILGTDINANAILKAKNGIYKKENLEHVNNIQLQTYFDQLSDDYFQVNRNIRARVEYEKSDMLQTNNKLFDIIFCRNVLIYYDRNAHEIIFKKFFDSLKNNGILILGQDESMIGTEGKNYFNLLYPRERIYQKKQ